MARALSPIHAPLDPADARLLDANPPSLPPPTPPPPTRIALRAQLDSRTLAGRPFSLGPGGASSLFARAVERALLEEVVEQLREGPLELPDDASEVRRWAADIVDAFSEEGKRAEEGE